jgi:hypothetical protein
MSDWLSTAGTAGLNQYESANQEQQDTSSTNQPIKWQTMAMSSPSTSNNSPAQATLTTPTVETAVAARETAGTSK